MAARADYPADSRHCRDRSSKSCVHNNKLCSSAIFRVPAGGEQNQPGRAGRGQVGAMPVAGVFPQARQRRPKQRDRLRVGARYLVPQRNVVQPDVAHLVAEDEPRALPVAVYRFPNSSLDKTT
jgi:hypothetical protein